MGHSISNLQEFLKCSWLTPQILLKLKPYDVFMNKMLSWKFQLHSSYGSKIITLQILLKISQNCLLSAASKIFPTLDSNNSPTKKAVRLKFGSPVAFYPSKSISHEHLLKKLSFSVKFCQKCQKMYFWRVRTALSEDLKQV